MNRQRNIKLLSYIFIIIICFLCLLFNYITINKEDYWADKVGSYNIAKLSSLYEIWEYLKGDLHPIGHYVFLYYILKLA